MIRRQLRIGIPASTLARPEAIGHGRVWHRVVRELDGLARVRRVADGERARVDAWIVDVHAPAPDLGGRPAVGQLHEVPWTVPELRDQTSPEFTAWIEAQVAETLPLCERVLTHSEASAAQIAAGTGTARERIDVVPHGVDLDVFRPDAGPSPVEGRYVLFVASLQPRKNLAAVRAAMEGLDVPLVVVAGPALDREDQAALEAAAFAPLPGGIVRVERPGDAELAALMAGCAAFCLPSLWEGFGLTVLEAMACGAPVVVSDRASLPELVGDAGVVTAPEPAALEAALRELLASDTGELRRAARARAETFTWRRAAEGWLASVERVL